EPRGPRDAKLSPGEAQRLLCISLKAHATVDAELCRRLAPVVGCAPEWLLDRWQQLHEQTTANRVRRERIRERRDRAWFRVRCLEARLGEAVPSERDELLAGRRAWHARYERARRELARMSDGPTHEQIADALGIAKGTVDSSVFKVRRELQDPAYRMRLARLLEGP
ncbi:MAG: hypothetical protein ACOC1I_07575, partial [Spirochaetota bacterium]